MSKEQMVKIAWRFGRVFLSTFLVTFGASLVGVTDTTALKALLVASVAAGVTALGKAVREYAASGDYTKFIHKMPL